MNKEYEQAVETVRREAKHHRYLIKSICAAYLGCEVDDVIIRCKKRSMDNYAKSESGADAASRINETDG